LILIVIATLVPGWRMAMEQAMMITITIRIRNQNENVD